MKQNPNVSRWRRSLVAIAGGIGLIAAAAGCGGGETKGAPESSATERTTQATAASTTRPEGLTLDSLKSEINSGRGFWVGPYVVKTVHGDTLVRPIATVEGSPYCEVVNEQTDAADNYLIISPTNIEVITTDQASDEVVAANTQAGDPVPGSADCISADPGDQTDFPAEGGARWENTEDELLWLARRATPEEVREPQAALAPIAA